MNLNEYQLFIKNTFDGLKRKSKDDMLYCIPIYGDHDNLCGYLIPIIQEYPIALPECAAIFAKWRNENPSMSGNEFIATTEGTEKWLRDLVINRDDRILFLIFSVDGTKIGHIGYSSFQFEDKSCEVDAVLRGEKLILPGMMTFALRALINWGLKELQLMVIRLRVFSDNVEAIDFYKRNCFYIEEENRPVVHGSKKTYTVMRLMADEWKEKIGGKGC